MTDCTHPQEDPAAEEMGDQPPSYVEAEQNSFANTRVMAGG